MATLKLMPRLVYAIRIRETEDYVTNEWKFTVAPFRRARIFNQVSHAKCSRFYDEALMEVVPFVLVEAPLDFKSKPVKVSADLTRVLESKL